MKNTKIKSLYTAVAFGLSAMAYQSAYATNEFKRIGDLEIYKAAEQGKVTITMMLDTSGSMLADQVDSSACDFPNGENFVTIKTEKSNTVPSYDRTVCTATGFKQYTYAELRPADGRASVWYNCNNPGGATCTSLAGPVARPNLTGNTAELASRSISIGGTTGAYYRYYRVSRPLATPLVNADRLTRLKDALFKLLDKDENGNYLLDSNKVAIGIGQFSSQSGANNVTGVPDGTTGKILVPARLLTETQRGELKAAVAQLIGGGGTPSASAYAEAGAYMLGTTTNVSSNKILKEKYRVVVGRDASKTYYACTAHSGSGLWCSTWTVLQRRPAEWDDSKTQRCRATNDTCYSEEISGTTVDKGLSGFLKSATSTKNGNNYISPINTASASASCDGQGIYFLTDGEPNSSQQPELLMTTALGNKANSFVYNPRRTDNAGALPDGLQTFHGTPQVGLFAKSLRDANSNPKGVSVRTAVVGFGSVFDISRYAGAERTLNTPELDKQNSLPIAGKFKEGSTTRYIDCSKILAVDARNACNWGAKSHPELTGVGGYGEGGFYSAQSTQDVINSVTTFLGDLSTTISASPSGTISVPSDPLNSLTIQPFAYLPMMQPDVAGSPAIWKGNLRKYHTLFGTLYGRDGTTRLYTRAPNPTTGNANFPSVTDPRAFDLWQPANDTTEARSVDVGGARSHLKAAAEENEPNLANKTSRIVYLEGGTADTPKLVKVQVESGVLKIDGIANKLTDLSRYSLQDLEYLVDFLGFPVSKTTTATTAPITAAQMTNLSGKIGATAMRADPVFGGVNHSVPVLASYEGSYDRATGNVSTHPDNRTDYLLYGSMDGALHMTDAKTGQEKFAFIPRAMFDNQREALADGAANSRVGQPYFGVDAPWSTKATYDYSNNSKVVADTMMAYGGLRMGGKGFYGLNLQSVDAPLLAFSISNTTPNFERLGQTWAKPTFTRIKTGPAPRDFREVVVFGGGYDMCYENPKFTLNDASNTDTNCANKTQAEGNAIYMVDAKTGAFIARWQASTGASGVGTVGDDRNEMKHSFISEIVALDRNNNGFVDSLYASDLGGQLFRIDLKEGVSGNDMTRRVVRVFNANADANLGDAPPLRFYEKPLVSFYDHDGGTMAMVNIASGDRSSPLHTHRNEATKANRIYGIIDRDLPTFRVSQNGNDHLISRNLENKHLHAYNTATLATASNASRMDLIRALQSKAGKADDKTKDGAKQGWWYPMTRFEGFTDVKHLKAIGSSVVMGGIYYTSIYSPDYQYTQGDSCSARLVGATERQMFCLPWGICAADKDGQDENGANVQAGQLIGGSRNGTLGYNKAGPGIQEIGMATVTAETNQSTNFKTIIGMQTLAERIDAASNTPTAPGGNTSSPAMVEGNGQQGNSTNDHINPLTSPNNPNTKTILKVDRWYDLATAESNQ